MGNRDKGLGPLSDRPVTFEDLGWSCHYTVAKFEEDFDRIARSHGFGSGADAPELFGGIEPYEVIDGDGNALMNAGINAMLNQITSAGTATAAQANTYFSNAQAAIGVGDSTVVAAATQTDLQAATNRVRVAMVSGFPSGSTTPSAAYTAQQIVFQSQFTGANFAWQEWGVFNYVGTGSPPTGGTLLNRSVTNLGTKASGTWTLTVTITLS